MAWPKFKTKDEVPEAFRSVYHEVGGEWVAKEEDDLGDKGKGALDKERKAKKAAEDRAAAAEAKAKELEEAAAAQKAGMSEEQVKAFKEETTKALRAEFQAKLDALSTENTGLKLDAKVKADAVKNGVLAERLDAWWTLNAGSFELDSQGQPQVKGGNGKKVAEYIAADLKKAHPYLYAGSKGDGGGAGGIHDPAAGGVATLSFDEIVKNPVRALGTKPAA